MANILADYPSSLPLPEGSDYQIGFGSTVLRSSMDDGMPRQRKRFSTHIDDLPITIYYNDAELVEFERFVREDINGGTSWFNMELRDGEGVRLMEVMIQDGKYAIKKEGLKWAVSMRLDIANRN